MNPIIAVYKDEKDGLASFFESEIIEVYEKQQTGWTEVSCIITHMKEIFERRSEASWPGFLRERLREIINALGRCRVIAGKALVGLPFTEFDRQGFVIFDIEQFSPEALDGILADMNGFDEEERLRQSIILEARPVETSVPGVYFLDLVALQTECPEVSSKMAMRDFFTDTPFFELRLLCNHIPLWLEGMDLDITSGKTEDGRFRAVIRKKCGGDL